MEDSNPVDFLFIIRRLDVLMTSNPGKGIELRWISDDPSTVKSILQLKNWGVVEVEKVAGELLFKLTGTYNKNAPSHIKNEVDQRNSN